jgi:TetR/AcrR family transcriptional regulator, transcriptional repressor for nem operon
MRVSRERAQQNRETVIDTASHLFRRYGFDGIGLSDLMKGAGLTQGGFYKQFASKEDLIEKASQRAIDVALDRWSEAVADRSRDPFEAILAFYLSTQHKADLGEGCPLVAMAADAARRGPGLKATFQAGIEAHLEIMEEQLDREEQPARSRAMAILSLIVGAVTLSRVVKDNDLSRAILDAATDHARLLAKPSQGT